MKLGVAEVKLFVYLFGNCLKITSVKELKLVKGCYLKHVFFLTEKSKLINTFRHEKQKKMFLFKNLFKDFIFAEEYAT